MTHFQISTAANAGMRGEDSMTIFNRHPYDCAHTIELMSHLQTYSPLGRPGSAADLGALKGSHYYHGKHSVPESSSCCGEGVPESTYQQTVVHCWFGSFAFATEQAAIADGVYKVCAFLFIVLPIMAQRLFCHHGYAALIHRRICDSLLSILVLFGGLSAGAAISFKGTLGAVEARAFGHAVTNSRISSEWFLNSIKAARDGSRVCSFASIINIILGTAHQQPPSNSPDYKWDTYHSSQCFFCWKPPVPLLFTASIQLVIWWCFHYQSYHMSAHVL